MFSFCSLLPLKMEKNGNQNSSKALRALKVTVTFHEKPKMLFFIDLFKNFLLVMADYRISPDTSNP